MGVAMAAPRLHAHRPHGQEDRERLPYLVVQAVLTDGVDVDLVNLPHMTG